MRQPTGMLIPRLSLGVVAVAFLVLGVAFLFHFDWATGLWPEQSRYSGDLTDLFVGSILTAIGASAIYGTVFGDLRAAIGGLLAVSVLFGSSAVVLMTRTVAPSTFAGHIATFWVLAALAAAALLWALRCPDGESRRAPAAIRLIFVGFTIVLLIAAALLILGVRNVFPWPLPPLTSALYGCLFLGVSMNYAVAAARGQMIDAKTSMFGFLIYDLILIGPFLRRFPVVPDANRLSLTLYVIVLVFSAIVAVWLFWFDRASPKPRLETA